MTAPDHWHPVLCITMLRDSPAGVRLHGQNIVLFRAEHGQIGALPDCCPHRRMRLSCERVVDHRLQCAYHGWRFDHNGTGESPGTPKLQVQLPSYKTRECHGAVRVKPAGSPATFPSLDIESYCRMCSLEHEIKAPLERVLNSERIERIYRGR